MTTLPSLQVTPQFSSTSYIFGVIPVLGTPPGSNTASLTESPPIPPGLLQGHFGDSGSQVPSSFTPHELSSQESQDPSSTQPNPRIWTPALPPTQESEPPLPPLLGTRVQAPSPLSLRPKSPGPEASALSGPRSSGPHPPSGTEASQFPASSLPSMEVR